ncbi:hypothetical protein DYB25_008548 [Aphanomyces astaci]|uniref:Retinoblastoma-associated protein A-box domain-containing protein n=1 Tax=Aphanomyces astaci TaxID=112090 RepID=A0A397BX13_APHAT|nr:hypothetical protein DYB25_008548 [Aphanomyces astaci]
MRLADFPGIASILTRLDARNVSRAQKLLDMIKSSLVNHAHLHSVATTIPTSSIGGVNSSNQDNVWIMSALFAILCSNELEKERDPSSDVQTPTPVTLQELMEGCQVHLSPFLSSFTGLFNMLILDLSPDLLHRANVLKERLTVAAILHSKYDQLWHRYADVNTKLATDGRRQHLYEAGWLVFVIVRSRLQMQHAGLEELYYLLLAVLNLVLSHLPNPKSVEAEVAAALSSLSSTATPSPSQLLEQLCAKPAVHRADVERAIAALSLELHALDDEAVLTSNATVKNANYFDPAVLPDNVHNLATHYRETYMVHLYDLDESHFLTPALKLTLLGPPPDEAPPPTTPAFYAPVVGSTSIDQAWQWQGQYKPTQRPVTPSRVASPRPAIAQTPVTAAVETNNWIRSVLMPLPPHPSDTLRRHFDQCASMPEAAANIAQWTDELMNKLSLPTSHQQRLLHVGSTTSSTSSSSHVEGSLTKTKTMGLGLFYKVLEALLDAEAVRIQSGDFSALLSNSSFTRALFACSMEVVLKAHSLVSLAFPQLLTTCDVDAFDFGKIIESFVKRAPQLPSELKRHMRDLEQTVLDSLVWASSSGLHPLLSNPQLKSAAILQLFFRKVLALAANRILALGQHLQLDAPLLNQVWTTVKECISAHHSSLLRNRHLDHMILCALYGVCKVNHVVPEVTFKRVLDGYKRVYPTVSKASIVREIPLDTPTAKGDVIKFYNRCFIPTLKAFLLQFQLHDQQAAAADVAVTPFLSNDGNNAMVISDNEVIADAATLAVERLRQTTTTATTSELLTDIQPLPRPSQRASPKRVLSSNLYISPLRQPRHQRAALTPRTHALYAFGESPARTDGAHWDDFEAKVRVLSDKSPHQLKLSFKFKPKTSLVVRAVNEGDSRPIVLQCKSNEQTHVGRVAKLLKLSMVEVLGPLSHEVATPLSPSAKKKAKKNKGKATVPCQFMILLLAAGHVVRAQNATTLWGVCPETIVAPTDMAMCLQEASGAIVPSPKSARDVDLTARGIQVVGSLPMSGCMMLSILKNNRLSMIRETVFPSTLMHLYVLSMEFWLTLMVAFIGGRDLTGNPLRSFDVSPATFALLTKPNFVLKLDRPLAADVVATCVGAPMLLPNHPNTYLCVYNGSHEDVSSMAFAFLAKYTIVLVALFVVLMVVRRYFRRRLDRRMQLMPRDTYLSSNCNFLDNEPIQYRQTVQLPRQ